MSAGHGFLHRAGDSPVHRLAPQVKIAAAVLAVLCVVATPREAFWAFGVYLLAITSVWFVARIPVGWFASRALIEVPFVILALVLPFAGHGERVDLLGIPVSPEGTLAGWNILAKGTLGVLVSLTLAATTAPQDLLLGLQRLRMPSVMVTIATLMLRYAEVVVAEAKRMRVARISRGDDPRFLWQLGATARGVGSLFIRSYERGERVHLAMVSRGWTGRMPDGRVDGRGSAAVEAVESGQSGQAVPTAPALLVAKLAFAYPDGHQALFGVDLRVEPGERVALLGPNGAGKTTFVLHLNGVLGGGSGLIEVAGLPVAKEHLREIRRRVGVVFQDADDQLFLPTARQDVAFGPANFGLRGAELDARVAQALEAVGMAEVADRSPLHLSGGQRRRVALATVLACDPEILVLDEPSANLEPVARRELAEVLLGLDRTMLMVTHDLPYALQLCPRSVLIDGGVVVADGPTREILADTELLARHRLELPFGFRLD
ncbi:cobalt/nickel transport system permease protein [Saccharothrix tamanrassetensis]|uniref:Cobalt/nickel transport system permease protein n=1 Tax=Saccharothrix tamanrassetensis TaxID=1051531 RepID=A0A841CQH6_9PSEU|nr:cobalt/nickel transport system permease protein [Saccharothrix tamanrassetensis]